MTIMLDYKPDQTSTRMYALTCWPPLGSVCTQQKKVVVACVVASWCFLTRHERVERATIADMFSHGKYVRFYACMQADPEASRGNRPAGLLPAGGFNRHIGGWRRTVSFLAFLLLAAGGAALHTQRPFKVTCVDVLHAACRKTQCHEGAETNSMHVCVCVQAAQAQPCRLPTSLS